MRFRLVTDLADAFRNDKYLLRKLVIGAFVGLFFGYLLARYGFVDDREGAKPIVYAIATLVIVAVCDICVLGLSLRDALRQKITEGKPTSLVLRLFFASGLLSLAIWVISSIFVTFAVAAYWPAKW